MRAVLDRRRNCAWGGTERRRSTKGMEQRRTKRSGQQRRKQISSLETEEMGQMKSSIAYHSIAAPLERKNTGFLVSRKIWK